MNDGGRRAAPRLRDEEVDNPQHLAIRRLSSPISCVPDQRIKESVTQRDTKMNGPSSYTYTTSLYHGQGGTDKKKSGHVLSARDEIKLGYSAKKERQKI